MKKLYYSALFISQCFFITFHLQGQVGKVGINTSTPQALLHVKDSSVLFTGYGINYPPGNPPVSGEGVRMMWYPDKIAFRAGYVSGTHWDKSNIGDYSVASGLNTMASGKAASAFGDGTIANGYGSLSIGIYNDPIVTAQTSFTPTTPVFIIGNGSSDIARSNAITVLKNASTGINTSSPQAMLHVKDGNVLFAGVSGSLPGTPGNTPVSGAGVRLMWYPDKAAFRVGATSGVYWNKDSIGNYSIGAGYNVKAKGIYSVALGEMTNATGDISTAMGSYTTASNLYATAMGNYTNASGSSSTAMGEITTASGSISTAMGNSSIASGSVSTAMGNSTTASASSSLATGEGATASGNVSTAMGKNTTASGSYSIATGINTTASGYSSTAMGAGTIASGSTSTAMGGSTTASGNYSTTMGIHTTASGAYSTAMGYTTNSRSYASVALGRFNDTISGSSTSSWVSTDPLFMIGNGTSDIARSNAITVLKNAKTGINTSSPQAMLHIKRNGESGGSFLSNASLIIEDNVSSYLQFSQPNNYETGILSGNTSTTIRNGIVFKADSSIQFRAGGNFTRMILDKSGNLDIDGVYSSSDIRLKKDISPLQNSLQKILRLNGYHYNWIDATRSNNLQTGVLAQEVEKYMPELVKTDKEGIKSVNYSGMIPYLVEAIKELKKENELLKKEIELLNIKIH